MLRVLFTTDVEVWCDSWHCIDAQFPEAFRRYVYGPTSRGSYGLPQQLQFLGEHGLTGVFFVEPLFSCRFGLAPLAEVIGLVRNSGQEVQLHLHTEWVDAAREALLPGIDGKRQHMRLFSRDEQRILIAKGLALLREGGAGEVNAFRAGNFAFNIDTLRALQDNAVLYDSSYNASRNGRESGLSSAVLCEPLSFGSVHEYPLTVYYDRPGHLRPFQVCACSFREMEGLLWRALEDGRKAVVILSHNFELLNKRMDRPNDVVVSRYRKLCRFLGDNRDCFQTVGFHELQLDAAGPQPVPLRSPLWKTGVRMLEQLYQGRYA